MISTNEKLAKKQRKILGPLGRLLLKVFRWEIKGKIPDLEKMILIGVPHTAMRDAWYALLAVWALDLKVNFFGAAWVFTRLPSLFTISKNLDRQGVPWPFWWLQKYLMLKLGGIPVYVPIEIDFKNRCFGIQEPKYITGTFEQESEKIASLFSGVEGSTRTFKML
jgi:hypothetical protein